MDLTVLDAGVVIAILNADDAHHSAARRVVADARGGGQRLVLPASAYAEVLVAPMRRSPASGEAVDEFLDALPAAVEPATREIARRAAELRARHGNRLRLPDALVVATAIALDADRIVTTDARWPDLGINVDVVGASPRTAASLTDTASGGRSTSGRASERPQRGPAPDRRAGG